jgi:hypothetical protein
MELPDTHGLVLNSDTTLENIFVGLDGHIDYKGKETVILRSYYSEALKGSNLINAMIRDFYVFGGYEDGVDFVRGVNYTVQDGVIEAESVLTPVKEGSPNRRPRRTQTFITIKGGVTGYTLRNLLLKGRRSFWWDISIGDHTIYNKGKLLDTRDGVIDNVRRVDGKRVVILVLDGKKPVCSNGRYRVIKVPRWLVKVYFKIKG